MLSHLHNTGIIEYAEDATIAPVLANLATRRDRRKRGLGKQLIKSCEDVVKVDAPLSMFVN